MRGSLRHHYSSKAHTTGKELKWGEPRSHEERLAAKAKKAAEREERERLKRAALDAALEGVPPDEWTVNARGALAALSEALRLATTWREAHVVMELAGRLQGLANARAAEARAEAALQALTG